MIDTIVIGQVYADKSLEDTFVRPVGWLGKTSVIWECVKIHPQISLSKEGFRVQRTEKHQLHKSTLWDFSDEYRELRPSDLGWLEGT